MKTLAPFWPRRFKTGLMSWPAESLMNRFFDWSNVDIEDWTPDMDLIEKPDAYFVKIEVPGLAPEDIHVTLEGRELTVKGERAKEEISEEDNFRVRERSYGSFLRSFTFPLPVIDEDIDAEIKHGLLTVRIKKAKEAKPTHIEVKST